jgi:hypothetical protein
VGHTVGRSGSQLSGGWGQHCCRFRVSVTIRAGADISNCHPASSEQPRDSFGVIGIAGSARKPMCQFSRFSRSELGQQPGKAVGDPTGRIMLSGTDEILEIVELRVSVRFKDAQNESEIGNIDGGAQFIEDRVTGI